MKKIIVLIGFLCWALGVSAQFGGGVTITSSGGKIDTGYVSGDTLFLVENGDTVTVFLGASNIDSFIVKESGTDTLIPYPDSFAYRPFDIFRNGTTYSVGDFSPEEKSDIVVSTTYHVDVNTGSDSNDGLSWATAFKSLNVAIAKVDADSVAVAKGVYWWRNAWQNQAPANDMKIVADLTRGVGDSVWITKEIGDKLTTGWTNVGSYYWAKYNRNPDTLSIVYDAMNPNIYGDPSALTEVATTALVNSTANSYRVNGDTIFVHLFDSRVPDDDVDLVGKNYGNSLNGYITSNRTVYLENINFRYSSLYCSPAINSRIYMNGMRAIRTNLFFDGVSEAMLFNFVGGSTVGDVLNYDPDGGIIPNIVEYNVKAHLTTQVGCTNCQASTAHNGISILRINGEYRGTNGQNIADVNSSKSVLYGCLAEGATPSSSAGFYFGGGADNYAMLERCTSTQASGRFDIQTAGSGLLEVRFFTGSQTNSLDPAMSITAYNPNEAFGNKVSEMAKTVVLGEGDLLYVAKKNGDEYLPTAILTTDLFSASGAILTPGETEGALVTAQRFRKGVSINDLTGAALAAKALSATTPALKAQAATGHTGNLVELYDASGVLSARWRADGRGNFGSDAATATSAWSWIYNSGNPVFNKGGRTTGQFILERIYSGTSYWAWKFQGDYQSGAMDLDFNNSSQGPTEYDFRFKAAGTFDVFSGFQIGGAASDSTILGGNNTNYIARGPYWLRGLLTPYFDPSITNEGSLTLAAATTNSVNIVSNTSGSTPVEINGDANTLITENTGTNDITISANQPILVHLTPISLTDSLKTAGILGGDYFTVPSAYNGYTIKSVVYGVRTASSGTGSVTVGLNIYSNAQPRGTSFVNALSATLSSGEVEEVVSGGGQTVTTGQLLVANLSSDTAVTHALGLTISIVLQPL